jgi:hypothetical protein
MLTFEALMQLEHSNIQLKTKQEEGKPYVFDPIRKGWYVLTPEEHVRQYLLQYLINTLKYPRGRIAVEKKILVGAMPKRFDLVVYDAAHRPWMLGECKAPEVDISEQTLHQILSYQRSIQCRYWLLSNGRELYCADGEDLMNIKWLEHLPPYGM